MKEISKDLTDFFRSQGITQDEIAAQLGVTQQYVSGLLSGKKAFGKKQANRFSELWGISPSWLLTGEGDMMVNAPKNHQVIGNNNGTAINGDGAVLQPQEGSAIIQRMQDQIDELLSQNRTLLNIVDRLTSK